MSTDHDIMRLPDPPPPAPDARAAALQQALVRFDQKSAEDSQGMPTGIRLIERTAAPLRPSRERSVMKRTRYLLAASLACVVAGSGVYLHLMRSPQLPDAAVPIEQQVASNDVAQAPSTEQAKKESESQARSQPQIQTATQAGKPNQEAAAPSAAAAPPPAKPHIQGDALYAPNAPSATAPTGLTAPMRGYRRFRPLVAASRAGAITVPRARRRQHLGSCWRWPKSRGIGASTFLMRPSLSAATSLPMRRKTPSRSRAMRPSRHSPLMSIRRRTRSSAHSSTAMCCRRPRRFGPRS